MTRATEFAGKTVLAFVLAITVFALNGCVRADRGQSLASAEESINAIDGLSGETESGGYYSGWVYNRWSSVRVTVDSGFRVADRRALVTWLIQTAWSMNDERPTQAASISITFSDPAEFTRWQAADAGIGLPVGYVVSERDRESAPKINVSVQTRDADAAGLGPWPGNTPSLPDNVIVRVSDG